MPKKYPPEFKRDVVAVARRGELTQDEIAADFGRRAKGIRTTIPAKDGRRAGDLLNRDFTAPAPNRTWVMDFTYVRA